MGVKECDVLERVVVRVERPVALPDTVVRIDSRPQADRTRGGPVVGQGEIEGERAVFALGRQGVARGARHVVIAVDWRAGQFGRAAERAQQAAHPGDSLPVAAGHGRVDPDQRGLIPDQPGFVRGAGRFLAQLLPSLDALGHLHRGGSDVQRVRQDRRGRIGRQVVHGDVVGVLVAGVVVGGDRDEVFTLDVRDGDGTAEEIGGGAGDLHRRDLRQSGQAVAVQVLDPAVLLHRAGDEDHRGPHRVVGAGVLHADHRRDRIVRRRVDHAVEDPDHQIVDDLGGEGPAVGHLQVVDGAVVGIADRRLDPQLVVRVGGAGAQVDGGGGDPVMVAAVGAEGVHPGFHRLALVLVEADEEPRPVRGESDQFDGQLLVGAAELRPGRRLVDQRLGEGAGPRPGAHCRRPLAGDPDAPALAQIDVGLVGGVEDITVGQLVEIDLDLLGRRRRRQQDQPEYPDAPSGESV